MTLGPRLGDTTGLTSFRRPSPDEADERWTRFLGAASSGPACPSPNGFHAPRHHYASVLLQQGVSIRAVADYLGHHDPGFTLRTYAHPMPEDEDRARTAIDSAHAPADSVGTGEVTA